MGALPSSPDNTIMCAIVLGMTILFSKVLLSTAFAPASLHHHHHQQQQRSSLFQCTSSSLMPWKTQTSAKTFTTKIFNEKEPSSSEESQIWTHENLQWKLKPPPETSILRKILLKTAANGIRLDCYLKRQNPPRVLCPAKVGGQAVLYAFEKGSGKKVARFGISTVRGPSCPEIDETIRDAYGIQEFPVGGPGIAAIIYMFVEPEYRGRGIGELALEAIAAIHTVQGVDFTVLVADDDGSGKLVEWYEKNGFNRAPKLQKIMGSPNGEYGTTMIAPTSVPADFFQKCTIKWW